jgi:hypothetical protein
MYGQDVRLLSAGEHGGTDTRLDSNDNIETGMPAQHNGQYPLYQPTAAAYAAPHVARLDPAEAVPFTWAEVSDNHFDHDHQSYVYGQVNACRPRTIPPHLFLYFSAHF